LLIRIAEIIVTHTVLLTHSPTLMLAYTNSQWASEGGPVSLWESQALFGERDTLL
jgi:hypothetical protein